MTVAAAHAAPPARRPLPAVRQDLSLVDGGRDTSGAQRWLIYDPLQHRYFSINDTGHALLQLWNTNGGVEGLLEEAWTQFALVLSDGDIDAFEQFLHANQLTTGGAGRDWRTYHAIYRRQQSSRLMRLVHNYVFLRIPLANPDRFLTRTLPLARRCAGRASFATIALMGLVGLYLVSREWDAFLSTLIDVFTPTGLVMTGISLVALKILHELAHAYTAKSFGCRVPVIGVAFILAFPMLYTDVTDTWRLPSRRQRMLVDAAGMLMDLAVSSIAIFLWAFLPPGPAKSIAFSLATTAALLSIVMNVNPLMKFDGYHMAADWLGIDNLHSRAIALAQWRMREVLFNIGRPPPEPLQPAMRAALTAFGFALWIYRLLLFTGIALAVYALFVKIIGIALFLVEIIYFIAQPIWHELKEWTRMRDDIFKSRRTLVSCAVLAVLVFAVAVPWSSTVRVPAVLEADSMIEVHPTVAARIETVKVMSGTHVAVGDALLTLSAPLLQRELMLAEKKLAVIALRQSRRASDSTDREAAVVLDQESATLIEKRSGIERQLSELVLRAPSNGEVAETRSGLHAGQWVGMAEPLFVLRSQSAAHVRGVVDAADLWRLREGAPARFLPDDFQLPAIDVRVESIASAGVEALEQLELVANFGGRVTAHIDAQGRAVPETAQYPIRAVTVGAPSKEALQKSVAGVMLVEGQRESILSRVWRQALKVVVRESGF